MRRTLVFVMLVTLVIATPLHSDQRAIARASNALGDLESSMTDLSKETQRDAEILRLLSEAGKSLDDWQKNNAVATAFAKCAKAEQLSTGQPVNPRVVQLARGARQLLQGVQDSPSTTDLQKTREQLRKPTAAMVEILSGEVSDLAHLLRSVSDVNESIGEIISTASAAVAGKSE